MSSSPFVVFYLKWSVLLLVVQATCSVLFLAFEYKEHQRGWRSHWKWKGKRGEGNQNPCVWSFEHKYSKGWMKGKRKRLNERVLFSFPWLHFLRTSVHFSLSLQTSGSLSRNIAFNSFLIHVYSLNFCLQERTFFSIFNVYPQESWKDEMDLTKHADPSSSSSSSCVIRTLWFWCWGESDAGMWGIFTTNRRS